MRRNLTIGALLAAITVAVYTPLYHHDFINFDDSRYITNNLMVRGGLTLPGAAWAMTAITECNWHPLTWLSHMLDVQLFGLWAGGHHLMSLALHVANALLLFIVLGRMTGAAWPSALVAALFALHPLHVESVAWAAERKDVLSTFFGLLALWAYAGYAARPSVGRYAAVFILLALGLMAKPMLVTLPCVMLLVDYWPLGRMGVAGVPRPVLSGRAEGHGTSDTAGQGPPWHAVARLLVEKLPLFALVAGSCVMTYVAQKAGGAILPLERLPLGRRAAGALVAYVTYLRKMVWPDDLTLFYLRPENLPAAYVVGAAALLAAVTALVVWQIRRRPYLAVGWFWYLGMLVPVIGLVQVGEQAMADRFTYLPLVGIFIMIAWGAADLAGRVRWRRAVAAGAATAVVGACALASVVQVGYWANDEAVFEHALNVSPDNYLALTQLGLAYASQGKLDAAAVQFRRAVEARPESSVAHNDLGKTLMLLGRSDEGIAHYREAVLRTPDAALFRVNLASALILREEIGEAIIHCREALRLDPNEATAHLYLGLALAALERFDEALAEYREALRLRPDLAEAYNNIGVVLTCRGRPAEAEAAYRQALRVEPRHARAHDGLANILLAQGKPEEAVPHYLEAIRLQPNLPHGFSDLAWLRAAHPDARFRNGAEAVRLAEQACFLSRRQQAEFLEVLAAAYAEAGRFADAVATAEEARAVALAQGQKETAAEADSRLQLYRAGRPFRMAVPLTAADR